MRFIHCSDLHLDSKMEANLSPARARQRNTELCKTFERMVTYAKEHQVRAILICGDLFDGLRTKLSTIHFVFRVMQQAPEIDFLYLRGNHDMRSLVFGNMLPPNLKLFQNNWTTHTYGDTTISGIEIDADSCRTLYHTLSLQAQNKNIVMLHGQVASSPGLDEIALPLLTGKHIDYLALGHLHRYQAERLDYRGTYCYSGCLEGRGFDECGEKGFVVLDTDGVGIRSHFVPFAHRRLHDVSVNISNCTDNPQILDSIRSATADISERDLVKITLIGNYPQQLQKNLSFLETMLSTDFYCVRLTDASKLEIPNSVDMDVSLKSEFIRRVMHDTSLSPDDVENILQLGLAALRGEELEL